MGKNDWTTREVEYSKAWAENHPALFTKSILDLLKQHPADYWNFSMAQSSGFFTVSVTLKP